MHKDSGDDLRVFVADKVGGALRLHKVERFDAAGGIARFEDIFQQAGGTLFAEGFDQHRTQVIVGVDVQRRELFRFVLELLQYVHQLFVGDLTYAGHRGTQVLDFAGGEVFEHLSRAIFANGHQQDDAFVRSGKIIAHVRYSSTGE